MFLLFASFSSAAANIIWSLFWLSFGHIDVSSQVTYINAGQLCLVVCLPDSSPQLIHLPTSSISLLPRQSLITLFPMIYLAVNPKAWSASDSTMSARTSRDITLSLSSLDSTRDTHPTKRPFLHIRYQQHSATNHTSPSPMIPKSDFIPHHITPHHACQNHPLPGVQGRKQPPFKCNGPFWTSDQVHRLLLRHDRASTRNQKVAEHHTPVYLTDRAFKRAGVCDDRFVRRCL